MAKDNNCIDIEFASTETFTNVQPIQFGIASEGRALEIFQNLYGIRVFASNFYLAEGDFTFFGSSCDGLTLDGGIIEVKAMFGEGYKNSYDWKFRQNPGHFRTDMKEMPLRHWLQIQWELFVTGAKHCYYIQYRKCFHNLKEEIAVWKVYPDHKGFIQEIYMAYDFWWKEDFPRMVPTKLAELFHTPPFLNGESILLIKKEGVFNRVVSNVMGGVTEFWCCDRATLLTRKNISLFSDLPGSHEHYPP